MSFRRVQTEASRIITEKDFYLVVLAGLLSAVVPAATGFALDMHRNFLTIACDTAVLQSGIVNTLHGNFFCNNGAGGPNILASHTTFILLLVAPLYKVANSLEFLFLLQVLAVYSASIPLYFIAHEILKRPLAAFLVAATVLISPLSLHMAMAPLHYETWFLTAVLWSYFCYQRQSTGGFLGCLLLAVCCGEQAALIYVALGVSWLLVDDGMAWRKQFGRYALWAGLGWLIMDVGIVTPIMSEGRSFNIFAYNYSNWHVTSFSGLPGAVLHAPLAALSLIFSPIRWLHILVMAGLVPFFAFLSRRSVLLLIPFPLYLLMDNQEFYLYFHAYYYQFAELAGYMGLLYFLARIDFAVRWSVVACVTTYFFNIIMLCVGVYLYTLFEAQRDPDFSEVLRDNFNTIPVNAAVYSPHRYSAYLSNRDNLVIGDLHEENTDFKVMLDARYNETHVHPEQIDYIVCDLINDQCGGRYAGFNPKFNKIREDNVATLIKSGQWKTFWHESGVYILKRDPH